MRATTLPPVWEAMADAAGGVGHLAAVLGIHRTALWKWAHGLRTPHPLIANGVNAWARRRGLREPFKVPR